MSDIGGALSTVLQGSPDLLTSPGLAVNAAQTSDPYGSGQTLAQVSNQAAVGQAADNVSRHVGHPSLFQQSLHWLGGAFKSVNDATGGTLGKALNAAGAPLREVQHEYRYLRDVWETKGSIPATLEALGIGLGAAAGAYFGGPSGAVLGGEAVGAIEDHLFYKDSYQRTTNGEAYRDPHTGQQVSIGRDIGHLLGLKPGSHPYTIVSGAADTLTDLALDPLAQGGKLFEAVRSEKGAAGALGKVFSGTGIRPDDPEAVGRALTQYPSVRHAFDNIAKLDAGQIVTRYPKLAPLAADLGEASTRGEVADVFRDNAKAIEMVSNKLPTRTLTRIPLSAASQAIQNYEGPGSDAIRALTSYLPTNFDPETLKLSNREFDPADDFGIQGVYRTARFSQSKRVAEAVAGEYANTADIGQRIVIYRNAVANMLMAKGFDEDMPFVKDTLERLTGGANPGRDAVYGLDMEGRNLSIVPGLNGAADTSAAVLANQTGKLAFPDFNQITKQARALTNYKAWYGNADDWIYKNITQGVFKKMALLSGGFAQRIALAEAIPAALRKGVTEMVRDTITANAAKLGWEADAAEQGMIARVVTKLAGGAEKVVADPERTAALTDLVQANDGHIVPTAVDTTTHYSGEIPGAATRAERDLKLAYMQIPDGKRLGDTFGIFRNDNENFVDYWHRALSEVSNDPASQAAAAAYRDAIARGATQADATNAAAQAAADYWRAQPPEVLSRYVRSTRPSVEGADPIDDWGRVIAENLKGVTHNPDGVPNVPLLSDIANGEATPRSQLADIGLDMRPANVKGREFVDIPHANILDRISNFGFTRVLDPIINKLSREPFYATEFVEQYRPLKALVDAGEMGKDEAVQLAQVRSVHAMVPFIHNTLERSQFAELAHNFMPFYFAQEQAFKRFGRLLVDDPGAFRRAQLMASAVVEAGHAQQDANGKNWLVYPGFGFLGAGVPNLLGHVHIPVAGSVPVSFSGQVKSLSTVFPTADLAPKFGPMVAIPMKLIENWFPEARPAVRGIIGDVADSSSIWSQLIPNATLNRTIQAFAGTHSRSFANAMMYTLQSLDYQQNVAMRKWVAAGHSPTDPNAPHIPGLGPDDGPMERQKLMDRVKNQTRITFLVKAALGAVTPAAPVANIGEAGLRQEYRDLISQTGNIGTAHDEFLRRHPDATPMTVFLTDSPTGAPILASKDAESFIDEHMGTITKYPYAGAWLIPQTAQGTFDQAVYNEQLAQGLRARKSPDQFLNDLYVAAGNSQFYNQDLPNYRMLLAQATGDPAAVRAVQNVLEHPDDPGALRAMDEAVKNAGSNDQVKAVKAAFSQYLTAYGMQNPVWWDDFQSATRDHERQLAVSQLQDMFAKGDAPPGPQTADMAALLGDYRRYQQAITVGRQDSYAAASRSQLKLAWQNHVDAVAKEKPNLAPVIQKVFRSL